MKNIFKQIPFRVFIYSDKTLAFFEIKKNYFKIVFFISLFVLLVVSYFFVTNKNYSNIQTFKTENTEIQKLKSEIKNLNTLIDEVSIQYNAFRKMVNLPTLNSETQNGGVGGSSIDNFLFKKPSNLFEDIELMKNKIEIQKQSFTEIEKKYQLNKKMFASFPTLQPMNGIYSSSGFGMRMHPITANSKFHYGLDIVNDVGTKIYAAGGGIVEFAGKHSGYGFMVEINHGYGYKTLYGHCSSILVRERQKVNRGDVIAKCGSTGFSTGSHLHYEVSLNGVKKNPIDFFVDTKN